MNTNGNERADELRRDFDDLKRQVRQRADDARKEVVRQLNSAAATIRREAREAGGDADAIARADQLASNLEKAAANLNHNTVDQMGQEATRVVVRNPLGTVAAAFGVGVILGFILRGGNRR